MCGCGQRKQTGETSAQIGQPVGNEQQQQDQSQQNQQVAETAIANASSR